jgi:hypothetical protein
VGAAPEERGGNRDGTIPGETDNGDSALLATCDAIQLLGRLCDEWKVDVSCPPVMSRFAHDAVMGCFITQTDVAHFIAFRTGKEPRGQTAHW